MIKMKYKVGLAIMAIAVMCKLNIYEVNAAEETGNIQLTNQTGETTDLLTDEAEDGTKKKKYLNDPLDNAVPVIYSYEIDGDGYITPGEEFTLKFNIYNPAVVSNLGNIQITVTQQDKLVYPAYGKTNSVYMGFLDTLSYGTGEIHLVASKSIKDDNIPINVFIGYTDNYSTKNELAFAALLPVSKSGKLSLNTVDIPSSMYVGSNNRLSITYSNDGLSTINDVKLHISGDEIEEREISLGSIGSSTSVTSDVYIDFAKEGSQNVDLYFSYLDRDGQMIQTDSSSYTFNVLNFEAQKNQIDKNYIAMRNNTNRILTLGVLVICMIFLLSYYMRRRKNNKSDKKLSKGEKV